jgi:oxygen-dependent protoporphyrinogen oxidase
MTRVVVVGAGITGLAAAHRLLSDHDAAEIVVLEGADRIGGAVGSVTVDRLQVEAGPDSFLTRKPWALRLCRDLGLEDDLLPAAAASTQRWTERGLVPLSPGPLGIPTSLAELWGAAELPVAARLRASLDLVLPRRRAEGDESIGSLVRRRLGARAAAELVEPLLGGVLGGDVDRVSASATFPEVVRWERERGSLIRGAHAAAAASRSPGFGRGVASPASFVSLRGGLRRLTEGLAAALGAGVVRTGTAVEAIRRGDGGGFVVRADGADVEAEAVIVTTSAASSAAVLRDLAPEAARVLGTLRAASSAVAVLVYGEGTDAILPASTGFVANRGLLPISAATLVSRKWPDPAFGTRAVVRAFVPEGELLAADDDELISAAAAALVRVYALPAHPSTASVVRWPGAMPQYDVGHLDRVAAIEGALPPGIAVIGAALRGVGLADRVREGTGAADRLAAILARA